MFSDLGVEWAQLRDETALDEMERSHVHVCVAPEVHRWLPRTTLGVASLTDRAAIIVVGGYVYVVLHQRLSLSVMTIDALRRAPQVTGNAANLSLSVALASARGTWARMVLGRDVAAAGAAASPRRGRGAVPLEDAARDAAVSGIARNEQCYARCFAGTRSRAVREALRPPSLEALIAPGKRGLRVAEGEDPLESACGGGASVTVLLMCAPDGDAAGHITACLRGAAGAGVARVVVGILLAAPHVHAYCSAAVPDEFVLEGVDVDLFSGTLLARGFVPGGALGGMHEDIYGAWAALVFRRVAPAAEA